MNQALLCVRQMRFDIVFKQFALATTKRRSTTASVPLLAKTLSEFLLFTQLIPSAYIIAESESNVPRPRRLSMRTFSSRR